MTLNKPKSINEFCAPTQHPTLFYNDPNTNDLHPIPIPNKFIERLMFLIKKRSKEDLRAKTEAILRQDAINELIDAIDKGTYEETLNTINWQYRFALAEEHQTAGVE